MEQPSRTKYLKVRAEHHRAFSLAPPGSQGKKWQTPILRLTFYEYFGLWLRFHWQDDQFVLMMNLSAGDEIT